MSSNYPEGSMRGSGIYAIEVPYDAFKCTDCGNSNSEGEATTDDWGNYDVLCEHCGGVHYSSSVQDDVDAQEEDAMYDAWVESQLDQEEY